MVVEHTYAEGGEYPVNLTVTDDDGYMGNFTIIIEIAEPDLDCDGVLNWEDIEYGETVTGSFTVENVGDPESLLNWEVESYPDWGTWTFNPESGAGLTPEIGPINILVEVVAPDEGEGELSGEVRVVNSDDLGDFCIIDASMTEAESQISIHPYVHRIRPILGLIHTL